MKTAANTDKSAALGRRRGSTAAFRCALLMLAMTPATLLAQGMGGSLGMSSDNVYRGVSLTSGKPAWMLDLHYGVGNQWVAGIGATAERPAGQSAGAQLTVYLDRIWRLNDDWTSKLGLVHYESPWNFWRDQLRYNELNAAIGYRGQWRASIAFSPDSPRFGRRGALGSGAVLSSELSFHQAIVGTLAADIGLGYTNTQASDLDYAYGGIGLSYGIGAVHVYSSLLWINSSPQPYAIERNSRKRWVTSLVWSF